MYNAFGNVQLSMIFAGTGLSFERRETGFTPCAMKDNIVLEAFPDTGSTMTNRRDGTSSRGFHQIAVKNELCNGLMLATWETQIYRKIHFAPCSCGITGGVEQTDREGPGGNRARHVHLLSAHSISRNRVKRSIAHGDGANHISSSCAPFSPISCLTVDWSRCHGLLSAQQLPMAMRGSATENVTILPHQRLSRVKSSADVPALRDDGK